MMTFKLTVQNDVGYNTCTYAVFHREV